MAAADLEARLECGLAALGAESDAGQRRRLLAYLDELARWSRAYNLTAVDDPDDGVAHHLLDSLSILPFMRGSRWLDVGTGAGLPGVPLAVLRPDAAVTLLDTAGKKVRFLRHLRRTLPVANIEPVQSRVEDYRPEAPFDTIVTRAFASLADTANGMRHLLAAGTTWLAMKGPRVEEELQSLPADLEVLAVEPLAIPDLHAERHVVIMCSTSRD